jgi:hypothetical protein
MHVKAPLRTNHKVSLRNVLAQLNACVVMKVERRNLVILMHKALLATQIGMLLSPSPGLARPRTLTQSAIHCIEQSTSPPTSHVRKLALSIDEC